VNEK
jgi:small subunit ribosomal protein S19e